MKYWSSVNFKHVRPVTHRQRLRYPQEVRDKNRCLGFFFFIFLFFISELET